MTDYTELKRLAENHLSLGQAYTVAKPSVLLALIAENELLKSDLREMTKFKDHMVELRETHGFDSWAAALVKVDKLNAENEALRNALRPLLAHWDDLKAGESPNVDAARAAMGKGEQS